MRKNTKTVTCPDCITNVSASADARGRIEARVVTDAKTSLRHRNSATHHKTIINSANHAAALWLTEREQKTNESWSNAYTRCFTTLGQMKIVNQSNGVFVLIEDPVDQ